MSAETENAMINQLVLDLVRVRSQRKISQVKLAKEIGVSTNTVAAWESGRHSPSLKHIVLYAEQLGLRLTLERKTS